MFENENTAKKVLFSSLFGVGTTLISSLILILISALILNFTPDPAGIIFPVGKAILYVTAIIGGYISSFRKRRRLTHSFSYRIPLYIPLISRRRANPPPHHLQKTLKKKTEEMK